MHQRILLTLILLLLASCSTTSASFVEERHGYSVTKGHLLRIDGLVSETVTQLADGVAFSIDSPNCRVALEFADGTRRVLQLQHPAMLVCGAEFHYVMQPASDSPNENAGEGDSAAMPTKRARQ